MKKRNAAIAAVLLTVALLAALAGPVLRDHVLRLLYPQPYSQLVKREAEEFSLSESLVYAVIKTESNFDEDAQSHAGARGLMQLTPQTFQWVSSLHPPENGGGDILDPGDNIHCGCALLRLLLDHYGSQETALCAYNAGMGTVSGWLAEGEFSDDGESLHTIPYPETENYVKKVTAAVKMYEELYESGA